MKKHIITSIVILAISSLVVAQSSRMGSASSTQLLVVPSAKHLSGGGAAATATGMDATFWNPAGLAMSEIVLMQFSLIVSILQTLITASLGLQQTLVNIKWVLLLEHLTSVI